MLTFAELHTRYNNLVWRVDITTLPRWHAMLVRAARIIHPVIADLLSGMPALRAMSLVYTTLLSLVPLLAVSFSVLKGFGVHNQIEPALLNLLAPLGEQSAEITQRIIGFVENMKAGVLGSVGLAMLIYTIISLTHKVERAFNEIWHVRVERPLPQRFSNYLSVILVGPVLVFSAIGLIATMMSSSVVQQMSEIQPLGAIIELLSRLIPYLLIIAAFSFVYSFVPNTRVKLRSALIGGVISSLLWNTTGWVFAAFISDANSYTAVYSAFASLILFMIWIYLNWLILLIGSSIAFYHQHPEYQHIRRQEHPLGNQQREQLTLEIMAEIANRFHHGTTPINLSGLCQQLSVPHYAVEEIIQRLLAARLIIQTAGESDGFVLLQPAISVKLNTIIHLIRQSPYDEQILTPHAVTSKPVTAVLEHYHSAIDHALDNMTLADLITPENTVKSD